MARRGSGIAGFFGGALGLAFYVATGAAWFYFLYKAIKLGEVFWGLVGFVIPPIGAIGGVLVFLGVFWSHAPETAQMPTPVAQQQAQPTPDEMRQDLIRSYATIQGIGALVDRCRWQDVTARDRRVMSLIADGTKSSALQAGATGHDVAVVDAGAKGTAGAMDCKDPAMHDGVMKMIGTVKQQYGAAYDKL